MERPIFEVFPPHPDPDAALRAATIKFISDRVRKSICSSSISSGAIVDLIEIWTKEMMVETGQVLHFAFALHYCETVRFNLAGREMLERQGAFSSNS